MRGLGRFDDEVPARATGRVGVVRLVAEGDGAATSTGGRFWTLVSSSGAAPAGLATTNPDNSPVDTEAINRRRLTQRRLIRRRLPIPAFPPVTAGCFDLRRLVQTSVIGGRSRASHKR